MILKSKGFSLIELMTVIVIMVIMMSIGIPALIKYIKKYNIEKETTSLYSDLSAQKFKSMNSGTPYGIRIDNQLQYTTFKFKDVNYNMQFDGVNEESNPLTITVKYKINTSSSIPLVILFDKDGLARTANWGLGNFTIHIGSTTARYNCIAISSSRIKMGVWNGTNCQIR